MMSKKDRETAEEKILESVAAWTHTLVDEAFEMAQQGDPSCNWNNTHEIADRICGLLAMHAQSDILDEVEEILADLEAAKTGD